MTLVLLLAEPDEDVVPVLSDPAQAIYRAEALEEKELPESVVSTRPQPGLLDRALSGDPTC